MIDPTQGKAKRFENFHSFCCVRGRAAVDGWDAGNAPLTKIRPAAPSVWCWYNPSCSDKYSKLISPPVFFVCSASSKFRVVTLLLWLSIPSRSCFLNRHWNIFNRVGSLFHDARFLFLHVALAHLSPLFFIAHFFPFSLTLFVRLQVYEPCVRKTQEDIYTTKIRLLTTRTSE